MTGALLAVVFGQGDGNGGGFGVPDREPPDTAGWVRRSVTDRVALSPFRSAATGSLTGVGAVEHRVRVPASHVTATYTALSLAADGAGVAPCVVAGSIRWLGVDYPMTFSGSPSVALAPLGTATCDPISAIFPVPGDLLTVTWFVTVATASDAWGGTNAVPATAQGGGYPPVSQLVTGLTPTGAAHWILAGDSITAAPEARAWPVLRAHADEVPYTLPAIGGKTMGWLVKSAPNYASWLPGLALSSSSHMLVAMGRNDIASTSASGVLGLQQTAIHVWGEHAADGLRVWAATVTPYTRTSDGLTTVSGQVDYYADNSGLAAYNAWLRDGAPIDPLSPTQPLPSGAAGALRVGAIGHPLEGIIDPAAVVEAAAGGPNRWPPGWALVEPSPGGSGLPIALHPSDIGAAAIAAGVGPLPT